MTLNAKIGGLWIFWRFRAAILDKKNFLFSIFGLTEKNYHHYDLLIRFCGFKSAFHSF